MRKKLLTIAAILTLAAVSLTILTMTVLAGSGNPGGTDSLHPDHSDADHAANKIVGVPCATGSHHKHVGETADVSNHIHHSTYYWYDSDEDENSPPPVRVVKIACGMAHDDDTDITDWGDYGNVGWNSNTDKFTFTGSTTTGRGNYTSDGWTTGLDRRRQPRRLSDVRRRPRPMQQVLHSAPAGRPLGSWRL